MLTDRGNQALKAQTIAALNEESQNQPVYPAADGALLDGQSLLGDGGIFAVLLSNKQLLPAAHICQLTYGRRGNQYVKPTCFL